MKPDCFQNMPGERWRPGRGWTGCMALVAGCALCFSAGSIRAQLEVANLEDSGPGSLRETIASAPPGSTITFAPTLATQTITLSTGELILTSDVTIDAAPLTGPVHVSGNDGGRVFHIASGVTATLQRLVIVDGVVSGDGGSDDGGGGIHNDGGNLTLDDCVVFGCEALTGVGGGILSQGTLTVTDCTIAQNTSQGYGGGIHHDGALTVSGSTISNNRSNASLGGGINHWNGSFSVTDSRIAYNHAQFGGGGVAVGGALTVTDCSFDGNYGGSGGGIYGPTLTGATLSVTNSTFSGNFSSVSGVGGGMFAGRGVLEVSNTTVSGNTAGKGGAIGVRDADLKVANSTLVANTASGDGGGIHVEDTATLRLVNSIVADNSAGAPVPVPDDICGGIDEELGANLITVIAGISPPPSGVVVSDPPRLAPLADYGGPTETMPPLPGSPVIEAAVMLAETPLADQRGAGRPGGPQPDLGAVEAFPFSTLALVDSDGDGVDDRLEPAYGLVVGDDDSMVDSDGDGMTDAAELAGMTDPRDPTDRLRLTRFAPAGSPDTYSITVSTFPGLSYRVEADQGLDFGGPGSRVLHTFTAGDFSETFEVVLAGTRDFVRVALE